MKPQNPIGIELFSGCGGLSTGFLNAGLRVSAGFDIDRRAIDAYEYNHAYRGSHGYVTDLCSTNADQLLGKAGISKVDFLIGGPPCQPFSIAGKRLGAEDKRATLISRFIHYVRELSPEAFLLENVPNLASIEAGSILEDTELALKGLGYAVEHCVLSAADFGVPQNRKRLIIMGFKGDGPVIFPEGEFGRPNRPLRTAAEAIGDLPDAGEFGEVGVYNHEPTAHSPDMVARLARLPPGTREKGSFHDRLHPDRPSYTLRAGSGNYSPLRPIHYFYDRVITVRESARLQGFSDDFLWPDRIPRLQQYRQVGNAVPPPLAEALAVALAKQLGWSLDKAVCTGDPATRAPANSMTDAERKALRASRMGRGASLGKVALAAE